MPNRSEVSWARVSRAFGTASGFYGLAPLSHEIAEWLTDPLLTNAVPAWTEPSVPQYGCSTLLEAGATDAEVSAITGQSREMVTHYSRQVNQRKLAAAAILKWEAADEE